MDSKGKGAGTSVTFIIQAGDAGPGTRGTPRNTSMMCGLVPQSPPEGLRGKTGTQEPEQEDVPPTTLQMQICFLKILITTRHKSIGSGPQEPTQYSNTPNVGLFWLPFPLRLPHNQSPCCTENHQKQRATSSTGSPQEHHWS